MLCLGEGSLFNNRPLIFLAVLTPYLVYLSARGQTSMIVLWKWWEITMPPQLPKGTVNSWHIRTVSRYNWFSCISITWHGLLYQVLACTTVTYWPTPFWEPARKLGLYFDISMYVARNAYSWMRSWLNGPVSDSRTPCSTCWDILNDCLMVGVKLKGKDHFLFMCRSDLTMMFHAVANNFREVGDPWVPGRNLSLAEQENRMIQNLWETVQILQHQGLCLDKKFGRVYPVCLAKEMDLLNFAFLLVGLEVMAPVPRPLRWEQSLQVPASSTQPWEQYSWEKPSLQLPL